MKAIRVQFKETGKRYYFSPGKLELKEDDLVVVSTIRGVEIGKVNGPVIDLDSAKFDTEIKEILRKATEKDISNYEKNVTSKVKKIFN